MSTLTSPTPTTARRPAGSTGRRTELARYTLPTGEQRILYGQRIDGSVRITDNPRPLCHGRAYIVERELEQDGNAALQAIVADYTAQAERLGEIPMETSLLHRYLKDLS